MTNPVYGTDKVRFVKCDDPFRRFFDLLPVRDLSLLPDSVGYTPAVRARHLGRKIGLPRLYLKNETVLPTGTTKYRMAAVSLPYLYEQGVAHFCASSTGNSSTAYARRLPEVPDLKMSLFTASDFAHRVNYREHSRIRHFILEQASFVDAFDAAGRFARHWGFTGERGFFNPGRREGLKLAFFEAVDQIPGSIDCYVQAVSSAMGVFGTFSGARELQSLGRIARLPRLFCVQQASCAPLARAWLEGSEAISERHIVQSPSGIAEAILRGNPARVYPYVRDMVRHSGGDMALVAEQEIRRARKWLFEEEGIDACFSASTALAGLVRLADSGVVSSQETVLVNLTGRDRNEPAGAGLRLSWHNGRWLGDENETDVFPEALYPDRSSNSPTADR